MGWTYKIEEFGRPRKRRNGKNSLINVEHKKAVLAFIMGTWWMNLAVAASFDDYTPVQHVVADSSLQKFFSVAPPAVGTFTTTDNSAPALGDWDGDGDLDFFVGGEVGARIFENQGSVVALHLIEKTSQAGGLSSNWSGITNVAPALADWNGDGYADLALGGNEGALRIVSSTGHFGDPQVPTVQYDLSTGLRSRISPTFVEATGDDLVDLLILYAGGIVRLYPHTGSKLLPYDPGFFTNDVLGTTMSRGTGIASADLNRDGIGDLFISDDFGKVWHYNQMPVGTFTFVDDMFAGTSNGFASRLTVDLGDPDGDGDLDLFGGYEEGGLVYLRNGDTGLDIAPPAVTVTNGQPVAFSVLNHTGSPTWTFTQNNSLGTLDSITGAYVAGAKPSVVDIVEATDTNGLTGRAFVNVVGQTDFATNGKAILVAGGKTVDDPVWKATQHAVNHVYQTLLHRGFSKANINYLSLQPGEDVDGNGMKDDIDGPTSLSNVSDAFETWVGNADKLLVVLADHGLPLSVSARMSLDAVNTLTAARVDHWLTELQDAHDTEVTVVMDFSYAGRFLSELAYTGSAPRIVVAASDVMERTYLLQDRVSFLDTFFNRIFQGFDVGASYNLAREAMAPYQHALLDDTKDGLYQKGVDGFVASSVHLGSPFVVGTDVPLIGNVVPGHSIIGESAQVWVENVTSVHALDRVFGAVIEPGHNPSGVDYPIVQVPTFELTNSVVTGRYEAELHGLTLSGDYTVIFYAEDVFGGLSQPQSTTLHQPGYDDRYIVLAGGSPTSAQWSDVTAIANEAYRTLRSRRVEPAQIFYFNVDLSQDADGDANPDVSGRPSVGGLDDAIRTWASPADSLTVYLIGPSETNTLQLNETEHLDLNGLDAALDAFQIPDRPVDLILEFSGSGAFLPSLLPPTGRKRVAIATSDQDQQSLLEEDISFSSFFLRSVMSGSSFGKAQEAAQHKLLNASGLARQKPLIDDNGNGIPNEKDVDGNLAEKRTFGSGFVTGDDVPTIGVLTPLTVVSNSSSVNLTVKDITDVDGIERVWAIVTPPPLGLDTDRMSIDLSKTGSTYSATFPDLDQSGFYTVTFFAEDRTGLVSPGIQAQIIKSDSDDFVFTDPEQPDLFELEDETLPILNLAVPRTQYRTFHDVDDVDSFRFFGLQGSMFSFETIPLNPDMDIVIEVYEQVSETMKVLVTQIDEFGPADGELIHFEVPTNGFYIVEISQSSAGVGVGGPGAWVSNQSTSESPAPGIHINIAVEPGSQAMASATIVVRDISDGVTFPSVDVTDFSEAADLLSNSLFMNHSYRITVIPQTGHLSSPEEIYEANPRIIQPEEGFGGPTITELFVFGRAATLTGEVVGSLFMNPTAGATVPVGGAHLSFQATDGTITSSPPLPETQPNWVSETDGAFPDNVWLRPDDQYELQVTGAQGYEDLFLPDRVPALDFGSSINVGEIVLIPEDLNDNDIPDPWEYEYLGQLATNVLEDIDEDGHGLYEEYVAGTDPSTNTSVFRIISTNDSNFVRRLSWEAQPYRTYSIFSLTNIGTNTLESDWLLETNNLSPSNLSVSGVSMEWSDPNDFVAPRKIYRGEVRTPDF